MMIKVSQNIKNSIINNIVSTISTTFTPVIPALIGCGMIKAVLSILVLLGLNDQTPTYQLMNFISDAVFYFYACFACLWCINKICFAILFCQ